MNETSATSASGMSLLPDGIAALTTIHFVLIAVLAILVVLGILWGIRQKRGRVQASRDVVSHAEEAGVTPETPAPADEPAAARAEPREVSRVAQTQTQSTTIPSPHTGSPVPIEPVATPAPIPASVKPALPPIVDQPVAGTPDHLAPGGPAPDRLADEPIAATSAFEASPAVEAAPALQPAAETEAKATFADALVTQLKGLGPKVAARLGELGVTTVGQMAALSEGEAQAIDAQLGAFTGRMGRDRWIEQARLLAAGDKPGFEAVFGKL